MRIVDNTTRAAVAAAAANQTAKLEALAAAFTSAGAVTVRSEGAGGVVKATAVYGLFSLITTGNPYELGIGSLQSYVAGGNVTPIIHKFYAGDPDAGGTLIHTDDALTFPGAWTDNPRVNLNDPAAAGGARRCTVTAPGGLPLEAIPDWMPTTPNTWRVHTTGNGVLTNTWHSQVAPWYFPFFSARVIGLYAAGRFNPYYGQYGALMGFGGGHGASNDNSAWALELSGTAMSFKRMTNPVHFFTDPGNPATWTEANQSHNSGYSGGQATYYDATYGEAYIGVPGSGGVLQTGQPAAPHSCDGIDFLGPALGGAAHGTMQSVKLWQAGYGGGVTVAAPHHVDFPTAGAAAGSYAWARTANATAVGAGITLSGEGGWSARLVPAQARTYIQTAKSGHLPVWFDHVTKTYGASTGSASRNISSGGVAFATVHVPERNLLLWLTLDAGGASGNLRIDSMSVGAGDTNPAWVINRPLAASIALSPSIGIHAAWCSDNSRLLIGNLLGDPNALYEITIPTDLSTTWPCERVTFTMPGGGNMPWCGAEAYPVGWDYNPLIKGMVLLPNIHNDGSPDSAYCYRPRGV